MNMRTEPRLPLALSAGDQLVCAGVVYTITGPPLGFGGSACVYPASCGDHRKLAIKECMPSAMALLRKGNLYPQAAEDYPRLQRYRIRLQKEIALSQQIAAKTRRAIGLWQCIRPESLRVNGMVWENTEKVEFGLMERLDQMGMSFGDMYAVLKEHSEPVPIAITVKMIRESAKALGRIHAAGYLHCDIQPNNIFFVNFNLDPFDSGDACVLDFGCAWQLDGDYVDLSAGEAIFTTRGYGPPELLSCQGSRIRLSKAADLYSLGALLLRCTLGETMVRIGNTQLGAVDGGRIGCVGDALDVLNGILRQLLAPRPEDRYQTCEQLIADLDQLLQMVEPPSYLLPGLSAADSFIGRRQEINAVVKAVDAGKQPFLFGLGGYGKSELAAQAAGRIKSVKGAYVIPYLGTMRQTILSLFPKRNRFRETEQKSYETNLAILIRQYRGAVLVIDNFWVMGKTLAELRAEPAFSDFVNMCPGIRVIFTTRYPVNGGIEVGAMAEPELLELMRFHLEGTYVEEGALRALIAKVKGHTLLLILMAKLLHESVLRVTPEMMLEALDRGQLHQFDRYPLSAERLGSGGRNYDERQLAAHLRELFRLYALEEEQKKILCCATLLPAGGMDLRLFQDALKLEKPVMDLIRMGLLERVGDGVAIHDLIRTAVREDLKPQPPQCADFLDALWERFDERQFKDEYAQIAECLSRATEIFPPEVAACDRAAEMKLFLGRYEDALNLYHLEFELLQKMPSVSSVALAVVLNAIGFVYGTLGRLSQQWGYFETAICLLGGELYTVGSGGEQPKLNWDRIRQEQDYLELARAYLGIAHAYEADQEGNFMGNLRRVRGYTEMALDILRAQEAEASAKLLFDAYLTMAGYHSEMEEWEDAWCFIDKAQCVLNALTEEELDMQIELGMAMADFQHCREEYHQEVLTGQKLLNVAKRFYPEDHPQLGSLQHGMAIALWSDGAHETAIRHMNEAVAIWRRTLPPRHPLLADSLRSLASFYRELGLQAQSLKAMQEAAEAGSAQDMQQLGLCFLEGLQGLPVDPEKGVYWLRLAADLGEEEAAYHAGLCLLRGKGCKKDPVLAEKYLMQGIGASHPKGADALCTIAAMKLGMDPDAPFYPVDVIGAYHYLRRAQMRGVDVDDLMNTAGHLFVDQYGPKPLQKEEDEP